MKFTKMQGAGNDYVYINCFEEQFPENPAELVRQMSDRHFGVGSDGMIFICPSTVADFEMVMFNSDGSRAQMCGNGIRCVGKFVYDKGLTDKDVITVDTLAGIKTLELNVIDGKVKTVRVNMGKPILDPALIPIDYQGDQYINRPLSIDGVDWFVTGVSMGNPHIVTFLPNIKDLDLINIGPKFELHPTFPERTNTEFAIIIDRHTIEMRVWERGSGETLACGTGTCATLVAAVLNGLTERRAHIHLLGGTLEIEWDEATDFVYMTGPAETVFEGEI